MDWDKLRIFHAVAEAGSFTHAADKLNLSQSAISRQISGLEGDLHVPLFHRHARGLVMTEQGETLYATAHDVLLKLDSVQSKLTDSTERPEGKLKVTTTVGLGTGWLTTRIHEFIELYPDIHLEMILADRQVDLVTREAAPTTTYQSRPHPAQTFHCASACLRRTELHQKAWPAGNT